MTDQQILIRAIVENPADPMPRLIYADWLEEYGRDYGIADAEKWVRFIRDEKSGCMLHFDEGAVYFGSLYRRDFQWRRRILKQSIPNFPKSYRVWGWDFNRPFTGTNSTPSAAVVVRHGFIEQIITNQWAFIRMAKGLFANHPVRQVWLTGQDPESWVEGGLTVGGVPVRYGWQRFGSRDDDLRIGSYPRAALIPAIWDRLNGFVGQGRISGRLRPPPVWMTGRDWAVYLGKAEAYADLSQACVAWGRSLAGLPALEVAA